jgi:hypothetical protein
MLLLVIARNNYSYLFSDAVTDGIFDDKTTCILSRPIGESPHTDPLIHKLKILLDPPRPFGGDVRSLADKFGYTNDEIHFLISKKYGSPTEDLLHDNRSCTIRELLKNLKSIDREDAVNKVNDYIKKQGCTCEECCGLR